MRVLVVNAGSSSLKLDVLEGDARVVGCEIPLERSRVEAVAVAAAVSEMGPVDAVGHRIVHGGTRHRRAVRIGPGLVDELAGLTDLAPLHQPKSLAALAAVDDVLPGVPAVACFDTAFHASLPAAASTYALPLEWRRRWGLRRFGFHGLAHSYAATRAAELAGRPVGELRIVSCHLGAGASLAAVRGGVSVDTTMGFTPLEGLVMATRSGDVDPGLLLWLLEHTRLTEAEMAHALEHESGLLALAGSADMRDVLAAVGRGDSRAASALEVYLHRLRAGIAAMAAAMDGIDVLVFGGGVGEHAAPVRAGVAEGLGFLGVGIDPDDGGGGDRDVSAAGGTVRTFVITAREDLEIARQVRALLEGAARPTDEERT